LLILCRAVTNGITTGFGFRVFSLVIFFWHMQKSNPLSWLFFCCKVIATCVILAHAILFIYDKYEDMIDHHVLKASGEVQTHYNNLMLRFWAKSQGLFWKRRRDLRLCGRVCSQVSSVDIQGMTCKYHPYEVLWRCYVSVHLWKSFHVLKVSNV